MEERQYLTQTLQEPIEAADYAESHVLALGKRGQLEVAMTSDCGLVVTGVNWKTQQLNWL